MKQLNLYIFLVIVAGATLGFILPNKHSSEINPIIGDESYRSIMGQEVPENIDEVKRIRTHLAYVEHVLRKKNISHLNLTQRNNRKILLDLLHTYCIKGEFPSNMDYPGERKPCFRDANDRICAVGYLVEETGHSALVDKIESSMNYDYIYDMENSELAKWVAKSGLTLEECALIQPTYNYWPINEDYVQPAYAISSVALTGIGAASSFLSMNQLNSSGRRQWIIPALGMASGISQIVLGSIYYGRSNNYIYDCTSWDFGCQPFYKRNQNISLLNIGIGTFTTALNTFAFVRQLKNRKKNKNLSWNMYGYQTPNNDYAIGINLIKRF